MQKVEVDKIYIPSDEVVAREIEDEVLIIPVSSRVSSENEAIFSLNETAKAIWKKLDGRKTLKDIIKELSQEYDASLEEVEKDVLGFIEELLKRNIVVKK